MFLYKYDYLRGLGFSYYLLFRDKIFDFDLFWKIVEILIFCGVGLLGKVKRNNLE